MKTSTIVIVIGLSVVTALTSCRSSILTYLAQWTHEQRETKIGDTVVQQAFIPPFRQLSQKIVFGVRISEIIKEQAKIGFSYETLIGRVEKGISSFAIEKTVDNKTIFKVPTFSTPGNILTRLVGPIVSVPYPRFCTQRGLLNVKQKLENFQGQKNSLQ